MRYTPEQRARIAQLYDDGLSLLQVAARVGCDHGTVRNCVLAAGKQIRQRRVTPIEELLEALEQRIRRLEALADVPPPTTETA